MLRTWDDLDMTTKIEVSMTSPFPLVPRVLSLVQVDPTSLASWLVMTQNLRGSIGAGEACIVNVRRPPRVRLGSRRIDTDMGSHTETRCFCRLSGPKLTLPIQKRRGLGAHRSFHAVAGTVYSYTVKGGAGHYTSKTERACA